MIEMTELKPFLAAENTSVLIILASTVDLSLLMYHWLSYALADSFHTAVLLCC